MVRSRLERRLLDQLDAYVAATPEVSSRSEAVRAILAAWLDVHGFGSPPTAKPRPRKSPVPLTADATSVLTDIPCDPNSDEVRDVARRMCAQMGVEDVDKLDAKGEPMWQRYVAGARRMLSKRGVTTGRGGAGG